MKSVSLGRGNGPDRTSLPFRRCWPHGLFLAVLLFQAGASYRTENFLVTAPTLSLAREVGHCAEVNRRQQALDWLGRELPRWREPCPITVHLNSGSASSGETSFVFRKGVPVNWQMAVRGTRDQILESVLPHEVTHAVLATHFRQPLPPWVDEGICVQAESVATQKRLQRSLVAMVTEQLEMEIDELFDTMEYPRDLLAMYCQSYSLTRFLVEHGGKRKFIRFVTDSVTRNDWQSATRHHYHYEDLTALHYAWIQWVLASP